MKRTLFVLIVCLGAAIISGAADSTDQKAGQMPPMGPPEQMKEIAYLEGTWDVKGKYKMDPTVEEWTETAATCEYRSVAGGAAMEMVYRSNMMGMDFIGISHQCYDREKQEWQSTWADNMSGRLSLYTGNFKEDQLILHGEDIYQGQKALSRITTTHKDKTSFHWKMESSMDGGETWMIGMEATYTKRQ